MSRKQQEINQERGKRLSVIIKESIKEKGRNKIFAEKFGYTKEHISQILGGNRNLTEDFAARIITEYPKYRIEWLMGYDDFKTQADVVSHVINQAQSEQDMMFSALLLLGTLNGYSISSPKVYNGMSAEQAIGEIKAGYSINKDGKTIRLSIEEMNAFENLIVKQVGLQIDYLMNQKEE